MPRRHNIDGKRIKFTAAEEAARDAEEAAWQDEMPMREWLRDMSEADVNMPRHIEDLWDVIGLAGAPQFIKDNHANKKTVRARKP